MSNNNIQFDTDQQQFKSNTNLNPSVKHGLIGWLLRMGIVKDEASANKFMIGIFIANVILILLIINFFL